MKYVGWAAAAALLVAAVLILVLGPCRRSGRSNMGWPDDMSTPTLGLPEHGKTLSADRPQIPGEDTVAVFVARAGRVLDSLERESVALRELAPVPEAAGEGEGPEYFVMFYYWLYEARDVVKRMGRLDYGPQFAKMPADVQNKTGEAQKALGEARERIARDRNR